MSHIPGPWAICETPPNPYWEKGRTIGAASDSDARRVCDVFSFGEPEEGSIAWHNARLIAAAPCMLAMLERIRDDQSFRTNDNSLWPELLGLIAKAKGEK